MKTSVKVLLGFLLIIFLVPTFFFMAFSYKIKKANLRPYNEASDWSRIDIGPSRFIRISSSDQAVLECRLIPDNKPHYMKWAHGQGGDDSVSVRQQQDTLLVEYIRQRVSGMRYHRSIDLHVADWQQLSITGAKVVLDSSFGLKYPDKKIQLSHGELSFGLADGRETSTILNNSPDSTMRPLTGSLSLSAVNSKVYFNKAFPLAQINADLQNTEVEIADGTKIDGITGTISKDSRLKMAGTYLAKLAGLVVK